LACGFEDKKDLYSLRVIQFVNTAGHHNLFSSVVCSFLTIFKLELSYQEQRLSI